MTEPTDEMIEAGAKYLNESGSGKSGDIAKGIYLAMQAVAPTVEDVIAEALTKRSHNTRTPIMTDRIEEIRADYENISSELTVLPSEYQIGWDDLGFILDTLATRDAEIERLKAVADAAQAFIQAHWHAVGVGSAKMADRVADAEVAAAARADSDAFQRLDSALTQWKETP